MGEAIQSLFTAIGTILAVGGGIAAVAYALMRF